MLALTIVGVGFLLFSWKYRQNPVSDFYMGYGSALVISSAILSLIG